MCQMTLMFKSGLAPLYLQLISREQPGMLSVAWELPPMPAVAPEPPIDQRPPKFNTAAAYAGYTMTLDRKSKLTPPWMPKAVVDDGRNTLIQFADALEGQQMPVAVGLQQNGQPRILASRFYTRQQHPEQGGWLYVQGLHPAMQLKDAAGISVKIVREVPPMVTEIQYAK